MLLPTIIIGVAINRPLPVAQRAIALEPGGSYPHVALARVLHKLGQAGPARSAAERGVQLANLVVTDGEPYTSGPVHIAFVADSREQVEAFHRAGLAAGGRDNGAPGVREQYSSEAGGRYYAAFLLDPDGNNVEAVRREF